MVTKAQLEAELAELKQQMAERPTAPPPAPDPDPEPAPEAPAEAGAGNEDAVRSALIAQGLDAEDIDAALDWIKREARALGENKPLLLGIGAFALGYTLGRLKR
jgi:hypothetical protein